MGFLEQVGLGIQIGEAITNGVVKYSKQQYLSKISTLQGLFSELGGHLNIMEGLRDRFTHIYTDGNADDIVKELNTQISAVKNAMKEVNEQIALWEAAINEMEETVDGGVGKVDEMHNLISSLDIRE